MGCQYIDVVLIRADIRIIRRHLTETFIPERHGMDDPIGFCSRGQMLLFGAGQIEGESQDAVYSTSGENCLLNGHFLIRPLIETAANVGILAFVVLANNAKINLSGLPILEWSFNPFKKAH